jgi:hypothetical protein
MLPFSYPGVTVLNKEAFCAGDVDSRKTSISDGPNQQRQQCGSMEDPFPATG